ncbi:hypothetical protein [Paraburkholderia sp. BCC1885]|jgi:hypothetical protein|uniref:hypothetical protein n=1 Tax=Paraburkholderia sp. BCC1885 TaxID=2562669 RepID=UPI0011826BC2|nr:hypothetical protein [Paraburkholderia sp. BCC1885]
MRDARIFVAALLATLFVQILQPGVDIPYWKDLTSAAVATAAVAVFYRVGDYGRRHQREK